MLMSNVIIYKSTHFKAVPMKRFGERKSLLLIIQEIKRLARKRNKLFQLQRKTDKSKDRHHFKQVKHRFQT